MAQQQWSQELADIGPAPYLRNPLLASPPAWRTCDEPPTIATALDAAPECLPSDWAA